MRLYLRIWKGAGEPLECKRIVAHEIIVKDGVSIKTDDGVIDTCVVVASDGLYHPVFDLRVS